MIYISHRCLGENYSFVGIFECDCGKTQQLLDGFLLFGWAFHPAVSKEIQSLSGSAFDFVKIIWKRSHHLSSDCEILRPLRGYYSHCEVSKVLSELVLQYPVYSLDNRLILSAGTALSDQVLEELILRAEDHPAYFLMQYGTVKKDLLRFLSEYPYHTIFHDLRQKNDMLRMMERVHLVLPVLRSLDYFKRYDHHTYRHMLMVFALSEMLAKELIPGYHAKEPETISSPTHDIGKTCVPLSILMKRTPLTKSEFHQLQHHTVAGYVLTSYYLKNSDHVAARVARDHHERKTGTGYPRGACEVDRIAEIVIVSDVYDALISPRPYRPVSYDNRTALEVITEMAEKGEVGWDIVKTLIAQNRIDKPTIDDFTVSTEKRGLHPEGNVHGLTVDDVKKKQRIVA